MLLCLLLGILTTLIAFPETPIGKSLNRLLVEAVARRLNRIRPGHLVFAAILIGAIIAMIVLFEWEGVRLVGMAAPEIVTWLGMFDAAVVLDLAAVAIAFAATTRFKAIRDRILAVVGQTVATVRTLARGRSRRDRPTAPRPTRSHDPDPVGWTGYAFG
jgi:hypothetical protein